MLPGGIKTGGLVAYAGRAGRVRGVETVDAAGASFDALTIEHTGLPRGVVYVPLHKAAGAVKPISAAVACELDGSGAHALSFMERKLAKMRAAKLTPARREMLSEAGRKGMANRYGKISSGGFASGSFKG